MACQDIGTIAALRYSARPPLEFVDIVEEFDIAFQACAVNQRRLTWDCDDIAIFDQGGLRIALGWMHPEGQDGVWHLIVAVGKSPFGGADPVPREICEDLTCRIIERTGQYLPHDTVYRGDADQPVDAALIDMVTDRLRACGSAAHWGAQARPAETAGASARTDRPSADESGTRAAAFGLESENLRMRRLREALCGTTRETEISLPMHLSIYALGVTMLLQTPPLGAALLVYTLLREQFALPV